VLQKWSMQTVTQPAQDIDYAWRLMSASEKPRLVTSVSVYSGTNTAAASTRYFILPSQAGATAPNDYNLTTQQGVCVFHNTFNLSVGTKQSISGAAATDRGGSGGLASAFIVPPGYILVAAPSDANLDGTVIHALVSCEIDC
jgi:hypothetical protein